MPMVSLLIPVRGADRYGVGAIVDLDLGIIERILVGGALYGVQLHFVPVPRGDVHGAVNVFELNGSIRREWIAVMEFLAQGSSALFYGIRRDHIHGQREHNSQNCSRPSGNPPVPLHRVLRYPALDEVGRKW